MKRSLCVCVCGALPSSRQILYSTSASHQTVQSSSATERIEYIATYIQYNNALSQTENRTASTCSHLGTYMYMYSVCVFIQQSYREIQWTSHRFNMQNIRYLHLNFVQISTNFKALIQDD